MLLNMIKNLRVNLKGEEKIGFFPLETGTINLYSQSIENNYWITIQNYQIILNHFKFARFTWHVKIGIAIQKKKKRKSGKIQSLNGPKNFFSRETNIEKSNYSSSIVSKRKFLQMFLINVLWQSADTWAPDHGQPIMRATFTPTISSRF